MPVYDVQCSGCEYSGSLTIKISELSSWDLAAVCPSCGDAASFRRVIKMAPASLAGGKAAAPWQGGERASLQKKFVSSGAKDDMKHQEFKRRDPDQIAAAIDIVKKGGYEGF